jgi:hypothetical protein
MNHHLGDDGHGLSQIKIWLENIRTCGLYCMNLPHPGLPPLALGQLDAFLQKYPFANTWVMANHL